MKAAFRTTSRDHVKLVSKFIFLTFSQESLVAEELAAVETDIDDINLKIQVMALHIHYDNPCAQSNYHLSPPFCSSSSFMT